MTTKSRYVYSFGGGTAEGRGEQKALLGGKGANLAEMARLGLPVPPGFTLTTEVCTWFYDHGRGLPERAGQGGRARLARVEKQLGRKFGDARQPLLVSVRSGARASMPGMMDTVLNLGLNDRTVEGLVGRLEEPALRLRLLPPVRRDVRRRRPRPEARRQARASIRSR